MRGDYEIFRMTGCPDGKQMVSDTCPRKRLRWRSGGLRGPARRVSVILFPFGQLCHRGFRYVGLRNKILSLIEGFHKYRCSFNFPV